MQAGGVGRRAMLWKGNDLTSFVVGVARKPNKIPLIGQTWNTAGKIAAKNGGGVNTTIKSSILDNLIIVFHTH